MKYIIFSILLFSNLAFSQWEILHPFNNPVAGLNYTSIDFVDSLNGWAATNKGSIIRTYDGGKNWITQTTGITSVIRKLRFADLLNGWAVGDSGKIIHTTNGGETWILQNSLPNMQLTMLSVINSQNVWAAGTWGSNNQGIMLHTTNGGNGWNTVTPNLRNGEHISDLTFINEIKGWYCTWQYVAPFSGGGIYHTSNAGQSWVFQQSSGFYQYAIFFIDENYGWSVGHMTVYRTSNGGLNWNNTGTFTSKSFSDVFFIDHSVGWIMELNKINLTLDGGINLNNQFTIVGNYQISDFKVIERRIGWAAVTTSTSAGGYLLHTTDGGGAFPSPPDLVFPEDKAVVNSDTVNFIWSTDFPDISGYRLILSTDSLFTASVDTFITDTSLQMIGLLADQKYYWKVKACNTLGYGAYSRTHSFTKVLTSMDEENDALPKEFSLLQNYPNPFNPTTTISWGSPVSSYQTIKLFDVLGRELETIVNGYYEAGNHSVDYTANSKLPSGVYYYQLRAGNYISTKKMIYLR